MGDNHSQNGDSRSQKISNGEQCSQFFLGKWAGRFKDYIQNISPGKGRSDALICCKHRNNKLPGPKILPYDKHRGKPMPELTIKG